MIGRRADAHAGEPTEGSQNHGGSTPHNGSYRRRIIRRYVDVDGVHIDSDAMYDCVEAYVRRSRSRYTQPGTMTEDDDRVSEIEPSIFRSDEIWDQLARVHPISVSAARLRNELFELALAGERLTRVLVIEGLDGLLLERLRPVDLANRTGVPRASSRGTADPTPPSSKRARHW